MLDYGCLTHKLRFLVSPTASCLVVSSSLLTLAYSACLVHWHPHYIMYIRQFNGSQTILLVTFNVFVCNTFDVFVRSACMNVMCFVCVA